MTQCTRGERTRVSRVESARLASGLRLPYAEQGDPAAVAVILLHAYVDSWRSFEPLLAELPPSIHALAPTQRGHGDADRPPDGYRLEDLAADVAGFMDAVGVEAAVLAGHSSGGYTAQRFAIDHPERTLGVVLVGAFRRFPRDEPAVLEMSRVISDVSDPVDDAFIRDFQQSAAFRPLSPEFLELLVAESRKVPARIWRAALQGLLEAEPPTEVGTVAAPTVIVWGDRDEVAPRREQEALAAAIPDSRLLVYRDTGHSPHWERPELVAADLVEFAEQVASR